MSIQLTMRVTALEHRMRAVEARLAEMERPAEPPSVEHEDLALQYERKFGAPPHHRMKPETIERALRE